MWIYELKFSTISMKSWQSSNKQLEIVSDHIFWTRKKTILNKPDDTTRPLFKEAEYMESSCFSFLLATLSLLTVDQ